MPITTKLCPGSNPSRAGMNPSRDVGEPMSTCSRGTRASSAPRLCGRAELVVLLGVMHPACLGDQGGDSGVARLWITARIHRGRDAALAGAGGRRVTCRALERDAEQGVDGVADQRAV